MHRTIARPTEATQTPTVSEPSAVAGGHRPIDIRFRLSALWIAMMFVFAYVDIFSLMRADVLEALLVGELSGAPFDVGQGFLLGAVLYILPASLMVYFSLTLRPVINRRVNLALAGIYAVTIALGCIGEEWTYYLVGSAVEVALLAKMAHLAWRWPAAADHDTVR